jgi:hypothetical protein
MELWILGIAAALLLISLLVMHLVQSMPRERAVPQPVIAGSALPVYTSQLPVNEPSFRTAQQAMERTAMHITVAERLAGPKQAKQGEDYFTEILQRTQLLNINRKDNQGIMNLTR